MGQIEEGARALLQKCGLRLRSVSQKACVMFEPGALLFQARKVGFEPFNALFQLLPRFEATVTIDCVIGDGSSQRKQDRQQRQLPHEPLPLPSLHAPYRFAVHPMIET